MKHLIFAAAAVVAAPAYADVKDAVENHALPAIDAFHTAATDLFEASIRDCLAEAMVDSYNAAYDAWMGFLDGKTVMSWQWSVRLVRCVSSP